MLKCREVTRLLTLENEQPLGAYRKVAVTLHLAMCHHCRRHRKQMQAIANALAQTAADEIEQADHVLDAEARTRITNRLNQD